MKNLKLNQENINICVFFGGLALRNVKRSDEILFKYYSQLENELNILGGIAERKIKISLVNMVDMLAHKVSFEGIVRDYPFDIYIYAGSLPTWNDVEEHNFDLLTKLDETVSYDKLFFAATDLDRAKSLLPNINFLYSLETFSNIKGFEGLNHLFPDYKISAAVHPSKKYRKEEFLKTGINPIFFDFESFEDTLTEYFKSQKKNDMFYASQLVYSDNWDELKSDDENDRKIMQDDQDRLRRCRQLFYKYGKGELFDGTGEFYDSAKESLTNEINVENKSVHCFAPLDYIVYMRSQEILKGIDKDLSTYDLSKIDSELFPSNILSLIQDLFKGVKKNDFERKDFYAEAAKRINAVDGTRAIHRGDFGNLAFKDYRIAITGKYTLDLKLSPDRERVEERMSRYQRINWEDLSEKSVLPVTYTFFDIINLRDMSIENGTFKAQFFLDMTSKNPDPIKTLSFNNVDLEEDLKVKKIKENDLEGGFKSIRYLIDGKFDFFPVVENYPFDQQLAFISYAITDESKYGILQPLDVEDLDKEFRLEGWNITDTRSGVFRRKVNFNTFLGDEKIVQIEKENRVGWLIKRSSSMTLLKVLIPLFFLFGVVMYSAAMPSQDIGRAADLLTVTFLASIALYFSSERPQPLTMTIIDVIFAGFYAITGFVSVSIFVLDFYPKIHSILAGYISFLVPLGITIMTAYILRRIKSKKFDPKMLSSDEN